jgi:hypothetical protein
MLFHILRKRRLFLSYIVMLLFVNQTLNPSADSPLVICAPSTSSSKFLEDCDSESLITSASDEICCRRKPGKTKFGKFPEDVLEVRVLLEAEMLKQPTSKASSASFLKYEMSDHDVRRFLDHHGGNANKAAKALFKHAEWRTQKHGADDVMKRAAEFEKSPINKELIWVGENKEGCPTLVVRSNFHDGKHYDDDPEKYVDFIIYMIEKGRKEYGFGTTGRKICLIVDRYAENSEIVSGDASFDMSCIPKLIKTFSHVYAVLSPNYPELLDEALVLPSSWFAQVCWSLLSKIIDQSNRNRFSFVSPKNVAPKMTKLFSRTMIPTYAGGVSDSYGGKCKLCCSDPHVNVNAKANKAREGRSVGRKIGIRSFMLNAPSNFIKELGLIKAMRRFWNELQYAIGKLVKSEGESFPTLTEM